MRILQLVKYDLISILKSPLTYLALILVIGMTVFQASMQSFAKTHQVDNNMIHISKLVILIRWIILSSKLSLETTLRYDSVIHE